MQPCWHENPPDLSGGQNNLVPVPVDTQLNLVNGQGTHDVLDPDEVVAVGGGILGGTEDPPDLDGTFIREIPEMLENLQETRKEDSTAQMKLNRKLFCLKACDLPVYRQF